MSSFSQGGFFRCRLLVLSLRASLMVPDAAKWAWECDVLFSNNADNHLKVPWAQTQEEREAAVTPIRVITAPIAEVLLCAPH